jgi:hypothetical protein
MVAEQATQPGAVLVVAVLAAFQALEAQAVLRLSRILAAI